MKIPSNLFIADLLHLSEADTFSWSRSNHGKTLIENLYIAGTFTVENCYG